MLISMFCVAQTNKQEVISKTLSAIEKTKGASYESTQLFEINTPADTIIKRRFVSKFNYVMSEYDSLYSMNFRYEKRKKTFNFDNLVSMVYNGQYYSSYEPIIDNQIPDPSYRPQDISKDAGKRALRNSVLGQIPHLYQTLKTRDLSMITHKADTLIQNQKYYRLSFMEDPIHEFEFWMDSESYLPVKVFEITRLVKNKPQLMSTTTISNYEFFKIEGGEFANPLIINQFVVDDKFIQYEADPNKEKLTLLKKGNVIPDLSELTVKETPVKLDADNHKIKLLYFGMISCCPCIKSIPHLKAVNEVFAGNQSFEMIAFYPYDPPAVLRKYTEKEALTYPVCAGGKQVVKAFGLHAYPAMLLTNKSGQIYKWYSYNENLSDKLITDIHSLLKK